MKIIISSNALHGSYQYHGADLNLPATDTEIQDAMERARLQHDSKDYSLRIFSGEAPDFLRISLDRHPASVDEVNFLARRLEKMETHSRNVFEGIVQIRGNYEIAELINTTYNLKHWHFLTDILTDYQLGKFYACNDFVPEFSKLSDELLNCVDFEALGAMMRKDELGVHTDGGYVVQADDSWNIVYDGKCLPGEYESHDVIIDLRLVHSDSDPSNITAGVWLQLPASEYHCDRVVCELGLNDLDECIIAEVKSCVLAFEYQIPANENITSLNTLAGIIQNQLDNLPKYKAALQLEDCTDLKSALHIAQRLDRYDFFPEMVSAESYGRHALQNFGLDVKTAEQFGFNFDHYGKDQMDEQGAIGTAYGVIRRGGLEMKLLKDQAAQQLAPEPEPVQSFEQTMGSM